MSKAISIFFIHSYVEMKSKTTQIQTLLFPRVNWSRKDAAAWARKHGFIASKVDATEDYLRFRQEDPAQFQENSFRTINLKRGRKPIVAVIARPWVVGGNPKCVLFQTIHKDWSLHGRKHELYARLARKKGLGEYSVEKAKRAFRPLVLDAARLYRRQHKIKPRINVVFPPPRINRAIGELLKEFGDYWKKGALDQYLPKSAWGRRQEK